MSHYSPIKCGNDFDYSSNIEAQLRVSMADEKSRSFRIEKVNQTHENLNEDEARYELHCRVWNGNFPELVWRWATHFRSEAVEARRAIVRVGDRIEKEFGGKESN